MLKRFLVGLFKGAIIGGAIGAGIHFGLGWTAASGLLAYVVAMAAGATAGVLAGKPPWRQSALIESILKAVAGVGVGALLYWVSSKWGAISLPIPLESIQIPADTPWTEVPLLISTAVGTAFGALIELDNSDSGGEEPTRVKKAPARVRVASEDAVEAEVFDGADSEIQL